jgi:hypothetical protein
MACSFSILAALSVGTSHLHVSSVLVHLNYMLHYGCSAYDPRREHAGVRIVFMRQMQTLDSCILSRRSHQ